jgi:hypothetical protein
MSEPSDRRPDPEIIPPDRPLPGDRGIRVAGDTRRTHYVYSSRIGPVGLALLTLGMGAVVALAILFLLGAAVIGLAAVGVVTVAAVIAGILRRLNQPLR